MEMDETMKSYEGLWEKYGRKRNGTWVVTDTVVDNGKFY